MVLSYETVWMEHTFPLVYFSSYGIACKKRSRTTFARIFFCDDVGQQKGYRMKVGAYGPSYLN